MNCRITLSHWFVVIWGLYSIDSNHLEDYITGVDISKDTGDFLYKRTVEYWPHHCTGGPFCKIGFPTKTPHKSHRNTTQITHKSHSEQITHKHHTSNTQITHWTNNTQITQQRNNTHITQWTNNTQITHWTNIQEPFPSYLHLQWETPCILYLWRPR